MEHPGVVPYRGSRVNHPGYVVAVHFLVSVMAVSVLVVVVLAVHLAVSWAQFVASLEERKVVPALLFC